MKRWFLLLFICIIACRQEERVSLSELNPDFDISFGEDYQTSEDFDHNLFFSGMELVPLETNRDAILGRPRKMIVRNGRYYFHNTQQNCVAGFDETGKQVYSTRPFNGKGPGEYSACNDYYIDDRGEYLYILDAVRYRICKYSLQDGFLKYIAYPKDFIRIRSFCLIKDEVFGFYSNSEFGDLNCSLLFYDAEKESILRAIDVLPASYLQIQSNRNIFYFLNEQLHFNHSFPSLSTYYFDTLGVFNEKFRLDFGARTFNPIVLPADGDAAMHGALLPDIYQEYIVVFDKYENNHYVFVSLFHKEESGMLIYNKESRTAHLKINTSGSAGMLSSPSYVDDNHLYYLCLPEHLSYLVPSQFRSDSIDRIVDQIGDEDNYVVVKYLLNKK
ncbi:MAG TPA: 6-bladed beta-propeller [Marinilabiliaceae bacterium]|nr:6-bladed beta-propeller [Marinilabiliaceae bacterium]